MEEVVLDAQFDAVLFNYTHDLLQSPRALDCIFGYARPGARIGIAGVKHPPPWLYPLRLYRLLKARACVTTFRDLARPWSLVERVVPDLCVSPVMLGINYCARGSVRG